MKRLLLFLLIMVFSPSWSQTPQRNLADFAAQQVTQSIPCDGVTDIGPALQRVINAAAPSNPAVIRLPSGTCFLNSAVVVNNKAVTIVGQGYTEGPNPAMGTWIKITSATFTPFLIENSNARGTIFRDFAVWQQQPTSAPGWTPTAYPFVFDIENTLGEVTFDHILLAGVTNGIKDFNSGRFHIQSLVGQVYTTGIFIDQCQDIPRIDYVHFWTYVTSDSNFIAYQEAHLDTILLGRVDGIYLGDIFALAERAVIHLENTGNGITSKAYISNLYADFAQYGIWIDNTSASSSIQVANATTQHNDFNNGATPLANSAGLEVDSNSNIVQIGNWRTNLVQSSAFNITGTSNLIYAQSFLVNGYNSLNNGSGAISAVATSFVDLGYYNLQSGNGGPLASTNGTVAAIPAMNVQANAVNFPFLQASSTGNGVVAYATGSDASVDFLLQSQGPSSSVRLQSDGQTVFRVDDNGGAGNSDVLMRSGSGNITMIAESGSTNANITVSPKGSGVFQSNSPVVLPVYSAAGTPAPTCNAGEANAVAVASDATTPTYNGTYTSGGAVRVLIFCTGSTWTTH